MQVSRRHVGKRLAEYYAQPADRVVGSSSGVDKSNLSSLLGEWHWRRLFRKLYEQREGHWLTPVELFRPHYSNILANFVADTVADNNSIPSAIDIIEIGAGRGTNASLILSHLRETQPEIYSALTYTLVDSSPSLHKLQQETLASGDHADKIKFELKDLMDVAVGSVSLLPQSDTPTVLLGLEILDNLAHDKIRKKSNRLLEQAIVQKSKQIPDTFKENFVPLSDPLLARVVRAVPSYAQTFPSWIPTVACGVLEHVGKQRPNLSIVLADFDWLPAPDLDVDSDNSKRSSTWAEGEPIITDMVGKDHACYLRSPQFCDILFPTDFDKLASFVKRTRAATTDLETVVRVEKQSEFLQRYGPEEVKATQSWLTGHTPLLHDFANCSVLTVTTQTKQ